MTANDREAAASARLGKTLGDKWTLESLLGVGAMAAVYAGRHRNGARAAIKVLHPHIARSKDLRDRFLREGYAANKVEHPGVAKVLDDEVVASGPDEGTAYLVMELLEGQSLEDRLLDGPPISQGAVMELARAVLDVLDAAHKHGVVHRDLKPENLFLSIGEAGVGKVKVLDFGLARISDDAVRTLSGQAMGTPSYMPPEQAAGRVHEIDGRADLFALAATCFRALTGRTVHPGQSVAEIVLTMAREKAPKIRTVAPGVSAGVARVIDRALEYRREDRYADAAAMRVDVDAALVALSKGEADSIIRAADILEVEDKTLTPSLPVFENDESLHPAGVPRPRWALRIGVVALVIGAGITWAYFRSKPKPPEPIAALAVVPPAPPDTTVQDASMQAAPIEMPDPPAINDAGGADASHPSYVSPRQVRLRNPPTRPPPKPKKKTKH